MIISAAIIPSLISMMTGSTDAQYRVTATNLAQQDLAQQRAITDRTQIVTMSAGVTRTVGGRTFTLLRTVTNDAGTAVTSATPPAVTHGCSGGYKLGSGSTYVPYINIVDTVTWTGNKSSVVVATRLAC